MTALWHGWWPTAAALTGLTLLLALVCLVDAVTS